MSCVSFQRCASVARSLFSLWFVLSDLNHHGDALPNRFDPVAFLQISRRGKKKKPTEFLTRDILNRHGMRDMLRGTLSNQ